MRKIVFLRFLVALDISKAFGRVWPAGLLHKLRSHEIPGRVFGIILFLFICNRHQLLDRQSGQGYPVIAVVPQSFILCFTHFILYINDHPDGFVSTILIYAVDTILSNNWDFASDLLRQLELRS